MTEQLSWTVRGPGVQSCDFLKALIEKSAGGVLFFLSFPVFFPGVCAEYCGWLFSRKWCREVQRSLLKSCQNRCGFHSLKGNCEEAKCHVFWHCSLLSKVFLLLTTPLSPPRYMINEITSSFWSHSGQCEDHFLTASNVLFLLVCVLSKYVSLGDSLESQIFILRVFLLISLILSEVFELAWGP